MCHKSISYWRTQNTTFSSLQTDLCFPFSSSCFENFIECVLVIFYPFLTPSRSTLTFLSSQFCVFFSVKTNKQTLGYPHILGYVAIHQGRVNLPRARTLKKGDSSFPWSYQLLISNGWAVVPTFPLQIGSVLSFHAFCSWCHNCCEFICAIALLCPEGSISPWSPTATGSYYFSVPSSAMIPESPD